MAEVIITGVDGSETATLAAVKAAEAAQARMFAAHRLCLWARGATHSDRWCGEGHHRPADRC